MEPEIVDVPEVLETPEEPETPETQETAEEKATRLESEKAELEAKNKQLFERAKKAEEAKKVDPSDSNLSPRDIIALAKYEAEDVDEILDWAKFKKVDVATALKDPKLQGLLAVNAETKRTAAATQTGRTPRGTSKTTGADLLTKAETTGELPDSDAAMQDMIRAKMERTRSGK